MPDWENLRYFLILARSGTLSGAARQLAVEHATVSRRIAALEEELGVRLVDRRGRRLSLTSAGERIAEMTGRMSVQAEAVERAAAGGRVEIAGQVTVSSLPALAATMLAEPIVELRRRHPGLLIRVLAENRYSSLDHREADIAVRFGRPTSGDLTATKVGIVIFHLYGSREYLKGTADSDWAFIGYDESLDATPNQAALHSLAGDEPLALRSNSLELQLALVRAGAGVAVLPDFVAGGDPMLLQARPGEISKREVWLVFHTDLKSSAPVRTVANGLRESLRTKLATAGK